MTQINVPLLLMERAYELCTQAGENPYEYSALLVVQALFPDLEYYVPPGLDRLAASGFDDILSDHKFSVTYE